MERAVTTAFFRAHCLELLDQVSNTGEALVVTKDAKALVRVSPIQNASLLGSMRQLVSDEDLIAPLDEPWEANS